MKYNSAQAAKLLSKLQQDFDSLAILEANAKTFLASVGEDVESVRPEYDYKATKKELDALSLKIRKVKHAINVFNTTTVVPEFGITIDELLVYIPQLSAKKAKLRGMADTLPKARENNYGKSNIIDYRIVNYDIKQVKKDLDVVTDELAKAQLALDTINHSLEFDIDI
ncbi:MAG: hypothetical protein IJL03_02540 [Lachnospiraceae bacterium]|jgi:hypothetical protein|nr:hypothetical protein [Lachnospiraceae bacterium]MBQ6104807.1 hypothetical protein [Lachnospiraceae bacterium]